MGKADENPLLRQALEYHRLGWCVIPVKPGSKKPGLRSWKQYQETRPDTAKLQKWFSNGDKSIAVIVGEVSNGLTCRDFDTMAEYEQWAKNYPDLAKMLPTVQTLKGMHVYFEGHIEGTKHISNGELRGSRGYCLLPPSIHPEGKVYQWVIPLRKRNLLAIEPENAGFINADVTEKTEQSENTEKTEQSEAIVGGRVIENIIVETLPKEFGTRNRRIFDFARAIRTLPQFTEAKPKQFREIVKAWHNRALPNIRTMEFEETWIDFLKAWPKIKYLKGQEPIMNIFEKAKKSKSPQIADKLYPDNSKLKVLASLCRELQSEAKENPFYLSVRTAGKLLDVSPTQASRWLFLMVTDGILKVVAKGGTAKNPRKATRFEYIAN